MKLPMANCPSCKRKVYEMMIHNNHCTECAPTHCQPCKAKK